MKKITSQFQRARLERTLGKYLRTLPSTPASDRMKYILSGAYIFEAALKPCQFRLYVILRSPKREMYEVESTREAEMFLPIHNY